MDRNGPPYITTYEMCMYPSNLQFYQKFYFKKLLGAFWLQFHKMLFITEVVWLVNLKSKNVRILKICANCHYFAISNGFSIVESGSSRGGLKIPKFDAIF